MTAAHGLDHLIADLTMAGLRAGVRADRAISASTKRIQDTARQLAPRRGLPHYAAKITREIKVGPASIDGVVGPERGGQGSLGHILENGTAKTPPHAHLGPALDLEGPRFMRELGDIAGDI